MNALEEQISRLKTVVEDCYIAVSENNGEVPEEQTLINLPEAIASTHDTLEELIITENGEYTPQDGVDGFRKVVAEFDTSSLPRVKVTGFAVNNACINDEGRWEGEQLIDTSEVTSLDSRFKGLSKLKTLNASNWDVSKVTTINSFVGACRNLEEINLTGWNTSSLTTMTYPFMTSGIKEFNFGDLNTSKVTSMFEVFYQCSKLVKCNVTNWDVRQVTDMRYMFALTKIQSLDLTNWEVNASVKMNEIFWRLPSLISVVGDRTIEEVLEGDISAIKNCHFALVLNETNLDRASLRAIINGLADLSDTTAKTLTLGATLRAKITEEDIAVATNKNWTIV